ncbi:LPS export ABC transporter periplasmic protein LptC [Bosea sp. 117]|uniref:LPS export ABC transporter periplasmic protein LptC n=1 Tax=Bosea sp. 117 TaxID=1125973 RepID=UPI0020BF55C1|nr:LPS export ABC transporter periplasmic protein LptC [Bosea sp. 117]
MNRHVPPPYPPDDAVVGRVRVSSRQPAAMAADFRAAKRHSWRVRFFKVALPIGVVVAGVATVAVAYLDPMRLAANLPFELSRVSLDGSRIKMEAPRLSGFTTDNRGYDVSATAASQDVTRPNTIDLEQIKARLEMADNGWAKMTAQAGQYDTKSQKLHLGDGVRFDTSGGYGGTLQQAEIDMKAGTLVSNQPVQLEYLDGKLTADTLEVSQKDSRAYLTGHVQLNFRMPQPDADKEKDAEKAKGTEAPEPQPPRAEMPIPAPPAAEPPPPRTRTADAQPMRLDGIAAPAAPTAPPRAGASISLPATAPLPPPRPNP